ncbi:MAG: hypothetical protein WAK69_07890, partial [Rhodoplanes sp.]
MLVAPNTPGGIIPFRWATSSRYDGRHHSVMVGGIISFWWATSIGISNFVPRLMQTNFDVRVAEVRATTTATTYASATATRVFQLNPGDPLALVDTDTSVAT